MTVGALLALAGAVIAFFGLRGFRPVAAPQGQAAPVVAVEAWGAGGRGQPRL